MSFLFADTGLTFVNSSHKTLCYEPSYYHTPRIVVSFSRNKSKRTADAYYSRVAQR